MKTKRIITLFFCFFQIVETGFSNDLTKCTLPDDMAINILKDATATFENRTFSDTSKMFLNRDYLFVSIPSEFEGFNFLASNIGVKDKGKIIPSRSGYIYIVGTITSESDLATEAWERVETTSLYYSTTPNPTEIYIYKKQVNFGDSVKIPEFGYTAGFTPLAKTINILNITGTKTVFGNIESTFVGVVQGKLFLKTNIVFPISLKIYDMSGRLLFSTIYNNIDQKSNISFLEKGIYIVQIVRDNQSYSQKISIY